MYLIGTVAFKLILLYFWTYFLSNQQIDVDRLTIRYVYHLVT